MRIVEFGRAEIAFLPVNAELQSKAGQFGTVKFLSRGEIKAINARLTEAQWPEASAGRGIIGVVAPWNLAGNR